MESRLEHSTLFILLICKQLKMKNLIFLFSILLLLSCQQKRDDKEEAVTEQATKVETVESWSKNATIYEVNIRQHAPEGTFAAFEKDLPRIKELGVKILWLMPISPIGKINRKGTLGSYYSIADYKGVNPEFGTPEELKSLVDKAHDLDLKIILDWVANHSAWDNPWMVNHKDWYTSDSTGNPGPPGGTDWSDVVDLNYDNNEMRLEMISSMKFWLTEFDVDGFRCDVASWVPTSFWEQARVELDKTKPVFMLAEAEDPELNKNAFHMSYGWEFMHIINEIAKDEKTLADLDEYMVKEDTNHAANDYRMYFITNHDENSWNGTLYERYQKAYKAYGVVAFTIDGMPLLYSGQESGYSKKLEFFEKDTVEWNNYADQEFYSKLIKLNTENEALWNAEFGGNFKPISNSESDKIYSFIRTKNNSNVFVVANLKGADSVSVTFESQDFIGEYTELFSNKKYTISNNFKLAVEPFGYYVFYK